MVYVNNLWKVQHEYYHQPVTFLFPDTGKYFQYALKEITEGIGILLTPTSGNDYCSLYKVGNFYNT